VQLVSATERELAVFANLKKIMEDMATIESVYVEVEPKVKKRGKAKKKNGKGKKEEIVGGG